MKNLFKEIISQVADDISGYNDRDEMTLEFKHKNWEVVVVGTVTHNVTDTVGYREWDTEMDGFEYDFESQTYDVEFEAESIELFKPDILNPQVKVIITPKWYDRINGIYLQNQER